MVHLICLTWFTSYPNQSKSSYQSFDSQIILHNNLISKNSNLMQTTVTTMKQILRMHWSQKLKVFPEQPSRNKQNVSYKIQVSHQFTV